jgi:hypothetical protein
MNKSLRYLVAAGLIGGACWVTYAWGQQSTPPGAPAESLAPVSGPVGTPSFPNPVWSKRPVPVGEEVLARLGGHLMRRGGSVSFEEMQAFQEAVEKLRSAKEGPEKETAKKELLQRLEQSFARDLEHREKELAEIESRVKKLREQIERRKKAKDEIVGLRLKTIVNESEGLGFSGDFVPTVKRDAMGPALRPDPPSDAFEPRPSLVPDDGR